MGVGDDEEIKRLGDSLCLFLSRPSGEDMLEEFGIGSTSQNHYLYAADQLVDVPSTVGGY